MDRHSHRRCFGTREVLSEFDEVQSTGKVFKKLDMGEYHWETYIESDTKSTNFGRGLRELGLKPK